MSALGRPPITGFLTKCGSVPLPVFGRNREITGVPSELVESPFNAKLNARINGYDHIEDLWEGTQDLESLGK